MRILVSVLTALLFSGAALAATSEEDVAQYIAIFSGDSARHNDAVESLAWKGLSDTRLYDVIERRLLDESQFARGDKDDKNRVARYIRALGFSGQAKYLPTINKYLSDKVYERYARDAAADMQHYQTWNAVISNRASFDSRYSDDVNRIMNMLRASDLMLKRVGAKRVFFTKAEEAVLDVLAAELRTSYTNTDPQYSDAIAWMVKALGSAKNPKYRPLLTEVMGKSMDSKVVNYAKQALAS